MYKRIIVSMLVAVLFAIQLAKADKMGNEKVPQGNMGQWQAPAVELQEPENANIENMNQQQNINVNMEQYNRKTEKIMGQVDRFVDNKLEIVERMAERNPDKLEKISEKVLGQVDRFIDNKIQISESYADKMGVDGAETTAQLQGINNEFINNVNQLVGEPAVEEPAAEEPAGEEPGQDNTQQDPNALTLENVMNDNALMAYFDNTGKVPAEGDVSWFIEQGCETLADVKTLLNLTNEEPVADEPVQNNTQQDTGSIFSDYKNEKTGLANMSDSEIRDLFAGMSDQEIFNYLDTTFGQ
jgi:hypothetical protein